jgi:hypothetical protein
MPDYTNAVIYTIRSKDNLYVGSTCNFRSRKNQHKDCIHNKNNKLYNKKLYKTIRDNDYEWDMKPYKKVICYDRLELNIQEELTRTKLNADLNTYKCHVSNCYENAKRRSMLKTIQENKLMCEKYEQEQEKKIEEWIEKCKPKKR